MEQNEMKNGLTALANQSVLSTKDKEFIRNCCAELGVEHNFKTRCKSCYQDSVILCLLEIKKREAAENPESAERRYVLRPGTDVYFGNVRVNDATITDELAEQLLAKGFDPKFFVKCE